MKIQSIQTSIINKTSNNYKENNVSINASTPINSSLNQLSFKSVANIALRVEGINARPKAKNVFKKAQEVKNDSNRAIKEADEFKKEAKVIHRQAKEIYFEAVNLLENGKFPSCISSNNNSQWEKREFCQQERTFEIVEYDNKGNKTRRIIATPEKIRIYHFDAKENRNNIYEFNCFGELTKFGYGAHISADGSYKTRKYYEYLDETGDLSIAAKDYKVASNGEETASSRYLFDLNGDLSRYDREYYLGALEGGKRKVSYEYKDEQLVSYMSDYIDDGGAETYHEFFEYDSKNGKVKSCHIDGHFVMANIDGSKTANERYDFENDELSAIYKKCTTYPSSVTAMKAFFYGGKYLLDGFSYYRKYGWDDPSYELRI